MSRQWNSCIITCMHFRYTYPGLEKEFAISTLVLLPAIHNILPYYLPGEKIPE